MRLHSPVDLTGNVNMIEKLVLGGTGTGTSRSSARLSNAAFTRDNILMRIFQRKSDLRDIFIV